MRRFVQGLDRGQSTLFPECLEDWIGEDNPVRVIDVFVDELDLCRAWVQRGRSRDDRPAFVSSLGAAEALYLRLSQPSSVKPPGPLIMDLASRSAVLQASTGPRSACMRPTELLTTATSVAGGSSESVHSSIEGNILKTDLFDEALQGGWCQVATRSLLGQGG